MGEKSHSKMVPQALANIHYTTVRSETQWRGSKVHHCLRNKAYCVCVCVMWQEVHPHVEVRGTNRKMEQEDCQEKKKEKRFLSEWGIVSPWYLSVRVCEEAHRRPISS